jgi:hypothetical protein
MEMHGTGDPGKAADATGRIGHGRGDRQQNAQASEP